MQKEPYCFRVAPKVTTGEELPRQRNPGAFRASCAPLESDAALLRATCLQPRFVTQPPARSLRGTKNERRRKTGEGRAGARPRGRCSAGLHANREQRALAYAGSRSSTAIPGAARRRPRLRAEERGLEAAQKRNARNAVLPSSPPQARQPPGSEASARNSSPGQSPEVSQPRAEGTGHLPPHTHSRTGGSDPSGPASALVPRVPSAVLPAGFAGNVVTPSLGEPGGPCPSPLKHPTLASPHLRQGTRKTFQTHTATPLPYPAGTGGNPREAGATTDPPVRLRLKMQSYYYFFFFFFPQTLFFVPGSFLYLKQVTAINPCLPLATS